MEQAKEAFDSAELTGLLKAWTGGDQAALDRLIPVVYDELRRMARRHVRNERAGNSLQTTALVNEVYLRLVDVQAVNWQDRAHFFAISARMMRRILTDFARSRHYQKRGAAPCRFLSTKLSSRRWRRMRIFWRSTRP